MRRLQPLVMALSLALAYPAAGAAPQGAQVVQGQVAINPGLIQQGSDKAIVNWQSFSIATGETLRIQQPGVNSVLLNRVVGGDPSLILGNLQANGRVFLVNPRGIVFGRGSQVDVGGLVASTLDLSDSAFLAGNYRFSAGASAGGLQADGSITATGGTVALVAPQLSVAGSIQARRVGLAAAGTAQVDVEGDGLVLFNLRNDDGRDVSLKFSGRVLAEGGSAELRAQARAGAAGQVLNMDGLVQARSLRQDGGRIVIDGGTAGDTLVTGRLDASGERGGSITVLGQRVALLDGAVLDASGRGAGGSLQVGGGFEGQGTDHNAERTVIAAGALLNADAAEQGDGGRIAIWADFRTDVYGRLSARGGRLGGDGGMVETSARQQLNLDGSVDVSAARGRAGQWLLDPNDLVISSGATAHMSATPFDTGDDSAVLNITSLNNALTTGANVTVRTANAGANLQTGNISVEADIAPAGGPSTLTLNAAGSITFNGGNVAATNGALNLVLQAGGSVTGGSIATNGGTVNVNGSTNIALNSVNSAGLTIVSNGGTVVLPTGTTGALDVTTAGGAVTQAGGLTVTGISTLSTGAGNITMTAAGNNLQGAVGITTTGITQISNASGNALTLGSLSTKDLTVNASGAALVLGSGAVDGKLVAGNTGSGTIGQTAALTVTGTTTLSSGTGNITLAAANNLQGAVDITSGGSTQIVNGNGNVLTLGSLGVQALDASTSNADLKLGSGTIGGNLSAATTGTGNLTQGGALAVGGTSTLASGTGDIMLTAANNLQGAVDITSNGTTQIVNGSGHALTLGSLNTVALTVSTSNADLQLGGGTIGGALSATTTGTGAITQGSALSVTGSTTLGSGAGDITLALGNHLQGAVSITSGGSTEIANASSHVLTLGVLNTKALTVSTSNADLKLGSGTVDGALSATTTGSGTLTQAGALSVSGTSALNSGTGDITLLSANNLQGAVSITSHGITQISNASGNALTLGSLNTQALTVSTGNADLQLGSGTVDGALSATTSGTGAITQGGALQVTGLSTLAAGSGGITLTSANDLQGAVSLTTTGDAQLNNASGKALTLGSLSTRDLIVETGSANLRLGSGTVSGNLGATTTGTGTITQGGALQVNGTTGLSNGSGDITLVSGNDLRGAVSITSAGTTQVSNAGGNALTLGSLSTNDLIVETGNANLKLGSGTVAGNLSATTTGTGTLTQAGALTVNGTTHLSNGSGDITLTSANNLVGAVALTSTGTTQIGNGAGHALTLGALDTHALTVSTSNADLKLGSGTVSGNLGVTTGGGAVTQGGALTVTGTSTLSSGAGDITLTAANDLRGAVSLTTTGITQISNDTGHALALGSLSTRQLTVSTDNATLTLGSGTVDGVLDARSHGGLLTQAAGGLNVNDVATLDAGGGDVALTATNHWNGVHLKGNALDLHSAGDLTLLSLTQPIDNALTLEAGGNLVLGPAATINTGAANLTLTSLGGSFAVGGVLKGHDIKLKAKNDLSLDESITATGLLELTSTQGQVVQTHGTLLVTGATTVAAGTSVIRLDQPTNHFTGTVGLTGGDTEVVGSGILKLGTLHTGNLVVTSAGNLDLGQGLVDGTLDATSQGGAITQIVGGGLTLNGATTLNAGAGNITLAESTNDLKGDITATGGAVSLRSAHNLHLLSLSQPQNRGLELEAGGTLTLPAGTGAINTGTEALTLSSGGLFSMLGTLKGGVVTLKGQSAVLGEDITASVSLSVTATNGTIEQTGGRISVTGTGTSSFNAGGHDIKLDGALNDFHGTVDLTGRNTTIFSQHDLGLGALTVASLQVEAGGALRLGTGTLTGQLDATAAGDITQAVGGLRVTGAATLQAGSHAITLTDAANHWTDAIRLTGGSVQLQDSGAVLLGASNVGSLALTAGGIVSQNGALIVGNGLSVDAGGAAIDLSHGSNQLGGTVALTGGTTNVNSTGALTLGALSTGALTVTAGGALTLGQGQIGGDLLATSGSGGVTQAGALDVGGAADIQAGTGAITLTQGSNVWHGVLSLAGGTTQVSSNSGLHLGTLAVGALTVDAHGALNLGQGAIGGALSASSHGGTLTQDGALDVTGIATLNAGSGGITLAQTGNRWRDVIDVTGGATEIVGSGALKLGTLDTGDLSATSSGALDLGQGTVGGNLVAASGGNPITQTGALEVTGSASFNAGSANITLTDTGNRFLGALSLVGNEVALFNQPSLILGTLSFNSLDATSNGSITLGHGSLSGSLIAKALGGTVTQIAGGLSVAGTTTLQASAGITLTDGANQLQGLVNLSGGATSLSNAVDLRLGTLATGGLTLNVTGALDLGAGTVGGALDATSSGAITQTGALRVSGASALHAGGAITLNQGGNAFVGPVGLTGGNASITNGGALSLGSLAVGNLTVLAGGALQLGTGTVGGDLRTSSGAITQAPGGLRVSGASTLETGGASIQLDASGNAFGGLVNLQAGDVTLAAGGALRLGSFMTRRLEVTGGDIDLGAGTVGGDLTARTRGTKISQTGALTVTGAANFIADGSVAELVLDQAGNQWLGAISMRGEHGGRFTSASLSSALDLSFGGDVETLTLSTGGRLTLTGGSNTTLTAKAVRGIVQTGPLLVSGLATLVANGPAMSVDLSYAGNDFGRVLLQAGTGGSFDRVQLRDGDARHDGLRITGDASRLELTSDGVLDFGGGHYAELQADTSATGAAITQSGALAVSGLTTLKAGSGDITLTKPDNSLPRIAVGSAGVASLISEGAYAIQESSVSTRLELGGPGAISLAGPLSGSGELVMSGSGSLTVTTAQGYSGGTRIRTGTFVLQGPAATAGSGAVQLGVDGQLDLRDGAVLSAPLRAQGGHVLNTSGTGTLAGEVTLEATTTFQPGAGGLAVRGAVNDGGAGFGLRVDGSGTLTLAGSNHYAGTTDIAAGTLRATGAGALPSTSAVLLAAGAVLALGQDQAAGSLSGAGRVELDGFTLGTGADGSDTTFSGSIVGSGGLTKLGAGRFTLAGSGSHTGTTRIAAGELLLASADALNDVTAVIVDAGATLAVQQSVNLGSLAGAGTVNLQAASLGVGSNGLSTRWEGAITGSGSLAKRGGGVFTLAGRNTLAGDVRVQAGTLQLDGAGTVPLTATVGVDGGATLELLSDQSLGLLTGSGRVLLNPFTLTLGGAGLSGRFDGVISGRGGLAKTGAGTLTLGGANVYTGTTRVSGGALVLDVAQALAGGSDLVIDAPAQVQANAGQAVASLSGAGSLVLNGASLATGAGGADSRFDGVVSGSGGLAKQGAGTLTLTAASTNTGATVIEAGTVALADKGMLGTGEIQNQGRLLLARSDAVTLNQAITGRGSLVVTQGQVTLANGGNSYSGATQVQGGILVTTAAERLPDASAVQVAAGAQLQLGGSETLASLQAAGSVRLTGDLTTRGEQVYTGSLTLANAAGLTLTGTLIDASRSTNDFGAAPLGLGGGQALLTVKEALKLGDVSLSNGGRIEAERLALDGKLQLTGGSLALVATAAPDDAKATLLGTSQVPVAGQLLAVAEATVQQGSAGVITLGEGAKLQVAASGGGSVLLGQDTNSFKGQLSVLSGANYDTAWTPNVKGSQGVQSLVRVAGQQVMVGGGGIEADMVSIRADQLATVDGGKLVARLPYDEIVLGRALSAPGLTLELAPGAFGLAGSFGSLNGQPIQIEVGAMQTGARTTGPNAGYVTVLPKAGAQGSTAIVLAGPLVGSVPATGGSAYRFFHDGASQAIEIPVVYNGVLPLTPAAYGALSSINGDAEEARRARFQETVRTENVTVRLRAGVIAEVGPGRPSTQGSEGARPPELCDPAEKPALSCKPPTPLPTP